jgi:ABC-type branched-subunit amino acid transport system substrate-binding protein
VDLYDPYNGVTLATPTTFSKTHLQNKLYTHTRITYQTRISLVMPLAKYIEKNVSNYKLVYFTDNSTYYTQAAHFYVRNYSIDYYNETVTLEGELWTDAEDLR